MKKLFTALLLCTTVLFMAFKSSPAPDRPQKEHTFTQTTLKEKSNITEVSVSQEIVTHVERAIVKQVPADNKPVKVQEYFGCFQTTADRDGAAAVAGYIINYNGGSIISTEYTRGFGIYSIYCIRIKYSPGSGPSGPVV